MGMSHLALLTHYVGKNNVTLCDTKLSTRALFKLLGFRTSASPERALRAFGKPDGVLIATPTSSHAPLAHWAIDYKIPFFVEKPLTLDIEASKMLLDAAVVNAVPAQMGFVLRYIASFKRLRELVAENRLGTLRRYSASMRGNVISKPLAPENWQGDFIRGGGCLNEYGPHILDMCHYIFGRVSAVSDVETRSVHSAKADDRVSLTLNHEIGTSGRVDIDWSDISKRKSVLEIRVEFEHATVRADNSAFEINFHDTARLTAEERETMSKPCLPRNVGFYLRGEEFSLEIEDFLAVCRRSCGEMPIMLPSLSDGYEVDRLIHETAVMGGLK